MSKENHPNKDEWGDKNKNKYTIFTKKVNELNASVKR